MRATVETHETSATPPPVKVRVSLGSEDLTIKVDEERFEQTTPGQSLNPLFSDVRQGGRGSSEEDRASLQLHVLHRSQSRAR